MMTAGSKILGTAAAAAMFGLSLPAAASAQTMTATDGSTTATYSDASYASYNGASADQFAAAMTDLDAQNDALRGERSLAPSDINIVSLSDLNMPASTRYATMQNADPSAEAALQANLDRVAVSDADSGMSMTMAGYLASAGVDRSDVLAIAVGSDDSVTVFTQ